MRRDAGASIETVSAFLDHSSLAVTSVYLRRLEGEADLGWEQVAAAIGVQELPRLGRFARTTDSESETT